MNTQIDLTLKDVKNWNGMFERIFLIVSFNFKLLFFSFIQTKMLDWLWENGGMKTWEWARIYLNYGKLMSQIT